MSATKRTFTKKETIAPQLDRWLIRRWRTERRYYVAEVMQDLWGEWLIKRSWGGIGSRRGSSMSVMAENYDHALRLLAEIEKRRKARGYIKSV